MCIRANEKGLGSGEVMDLSLQVLQKHLLRSDWRAFSVLSGRSDASKPANF